MVRWLESQTPICPQGACLLVCLIQESKSFPTVLSSCFQMVWDCCSSSESILPKSYTVNCPFWRVVQYVSHYMHLLPTLFIPAGPTGVSLSISSTWLCLNLMTSALNKKTISCRTLRPYPLIKLGPQVTQWVLTDGYNSMPRTFLNIIKLSVPTGCREYEVCI